MYGMIHSAMRQMVVERLGEDQWLKLEREMQLGPPDFISLTVYDDAVTLRILDASARALDLTIEQALRAFGRFWVHFADGGPFASVMDFTGQSLADFVRNLDLMHRAVSATLPGARMPNFSVAAEHPDGIRVHYSSTREGLEPFVCGLLEGLMERFGLAGEVAHVAGTAQPAKFDVSFSQGRDGSGVRS